MPEPTPIHQAFSAYAPSYDRSLEPILALKDALHMLLRWQLSALPDDARVLLVGAGTGAEARFLAPLFPGWRLTLVDPAEGMLAVARGHAEAEGFAARCTFHVGPVSTVEDRPFDAAVSVLASHFLNDAADRQAFYAEIGARLVPGGPYFEACLCADRADASFGPLLELWLAQPGMPEASRENFRGAFGVGFAAHGPAEVEGMLAAAGFPAPVRCFQASLVRAWVARRGAAPR